MSKNSIYLGDGVYLSNDGFQLWLTVGDHALDIIALEPEVFERLITEGKKMFEDMQKATETPQTKLE